jgi:hypothetical protein
VFHKSLHTIHKLTTVFRSESEFISIANMAEELHSFAEGFFKFRDLPGCPIKACFHLTNLFSKCRKTCECLMLYSETVKQLFIDIRKAYDS